MIRTVVGSESAIPPALLSVTVIWSVVPEIHEERFVDVAIPVPFTITKRDGVRPVNVSAFDTERFVDVAFVVVPLVTTALVAVRFEIVDVVATKEFTERELPTAFPNTKPPENVEVAVVDVALNVGAEIEPVTERFETENDPTVSAPEIAASPVTVSPPLTVVVPAWNVPPTEPFPVTVSVVPERAPPLPPPLVVSPSSSAETRSPIFAMRSSIA